MFFAVMALPRNPFRTTHSWLHLLVQSPRKNVRCRSVFVLEVRGRAESRPGTVSLGVFHNAKPHACVCARTHTHT